MWEQHEPISVLSQNLCVNGTWIVWAEAYKYFSSPTGKCQIENLPMKKVLIDAEGVFCVLADNIYNFPVNASVHMKSFKSCMQNSRA